MNSINISSSYSKPIVSNSAVSNANYETGSRKRKISEIGENAINDTEKKQKVERGLTQEISFLANESHMDISFPPQNSENKRKDSLESFFNELNELVEEPTESQKKLLFHMIDEHKKFAIKLFPQENEISIFSLLLKPNFQSIKAETLIKIDRHLKIGYDKVEALLEVALAYKTNNFLDALKAIFILSEIENTQIFTEAATAQAKLLTLFKQATDKKDFQPLITEINFRISENYEQFYNPVKYNLDPIAFNFFLDKDEDQYLIDNKINFEGSRTYQNLYPFMSALKQSLNHDSVKQESGILTQKLFEPFKIWPFLELNFTSENVFINFFAEYIVSKIQQSNFNTILLPVGFFSHAMCLLIEKKTETTVTLTVFNTGDGIQEYHYPHPDTTKSNVYQTFLTYTDVPLHNLLSKDKWMEILKLENEGNNRLFYSFINDVMTVGGKRLPRSEDNLDFESTQKKGTCAAQCIMAFFRYQIRNCIVGSSDHKQGFYKYFKALLLKNLGDAIIPKVQDKNLLLLLNKKKCSIQKEVQLLEESINETNQNKANTYNSKKSLTNYYKRSVFSNYEENYRTMKMMSKLIPV